MTEGLTQVMMVRENLDDLPDFDLPEPYKIRWFKPGDEKIWVKIERESETHVPTTIEIFQREFGYDTGALEKRQFFLCDGNGKEIGTSTAWYDNDHNGKVYGRIHWTAIIFSARGKGLAKPLVSVTCSRLQELGHKRIYLTTETVRIPAINLYLKFGFVPEIKNRNDISAWRKVSKSIKHPALEKLIYGRPTFFADSVRIFHR